VSYVTVFEVTRESIPLWIPVLFLFFSLLGAIFYLGTRDSGFAKWVFMPFVLLFACIWLAATSYYFLGRRHDLRAYQNGKYKLVEGPVEHYSWKGKTECFSVRGVEFCHGTANIVGWDPPLRFGPSTWPVGFIHDGLPVRVAYSGDPYLKILRLDISR